MKDTHQSRFISTRTSRKRAIIIGASGSLGTPLAKALAGRGRPVIGTCHSRSCQGLLTFDMTSRRISDLVTDLNPADTVFLMAAMTRPDQVHHRPNQALAVNIRGTQNQIDDILQKNAHLVFLSSTQVFDGQRGGYTETDPTNPLTDYGRNKRAIEDYLQTRAGRWCILRTDATVTPRILDNCPVEKTYVSLWGRHARMATDNILGLTAVQDTVAFLCWVSAHAVTGLFHFAGPAVSRSVLADWIMAESRYASHMAFEPIQYQDLVFPEPRPVRTWLNSDKATSASGIAPIHTRDAVRQKVAAIDDYVEKKGTYWIC